MNFVNCLPGRVEKLQATADFIAVPLFDGKSMRPDFRKYAQIDLRAQHHGALLAGDDLFIDADLLVNGAVVARQRHDFAKRLQADQQVVHARLDAKPPYLRNERRSVPPRIFRV